MILILKAVGILLLVLFLLLLLLLLLILFVPIRYHVEGEKEKDYYAEIRISWLLRIFRFKGRYDRQGFRYRIKALFWTVSKSDDKKTA